jgi:fructose-1,6-bisphosphatase/inositol monophosphatase family enzyme
MERIKSHEVRRRQEFIVPTVRMLGRRVCELLKEGDIGRRDKGGSDVTNVDIAINDEAIELFGKQFPDDVVLGEEGWSHKSGINPRRWAHRLDSIDSTSSLIKAHAAGDYRDCRSTILVSSFAPGQQAPSVSVVHSPFLKGEPTLYAVGDRVFQETAVGERVETQSVRPLRGGPRRLADVKAFDCVSWRKVRPNFREILERERPGRRIDRKMSMGAVALGNVAFSVFPGTMHDSANPHDVAAGAHIGRAAGATVRTLGGRHYEEVDWLRGPIDGVVVAATPELADEVVGLYQRLAA